MTKDMTVAEEVAMGGAGVGLWLPEKRSALEAAPWLASFCDLEVQDDDSIDLLVHRPSAIGLAGPQRTSRCWFNLGPEPLDDNEQAGFPGFDRPPAMDLGLSACARGRDNDLLLGHLALFLAECFDALIDFRGLLGYRHSMDDLNGDEKNTRLAESRALVASLPGRVWEMPYEMDEGLYGYTHVADREFLAAWLGHPRFHMIT